MQVQIVVGPWYNCFMTTNVSGPGGIRNNINHLHDNHESCKKCNGVIYLRTLGCGRCLRSAQKLNQNNSLDSFDVAVQNDSEWGYNRSMVANTNLGAVAGNNEQVEARMVEATWLCVGRYLEEDGGRTRLRVERYTDGTGNVFRLNDDGTEYRWFVEGLPFEAQAGAYVADSKHYDVRPVAV